MRTPVLLCATLLLATAFAACNRHPAERTLAFINAHKHHGQHEPGNQTAHPAHDTKDSHDTNHERPTPEHPGDQTKPQPRPFFPAAR